MNTHRFRSFGLGILLAVLLILAACSNDTSSVDDKLVGVWKGQEGDLLILMNNHTGIQRFSFNAEVDIVWSATDKELIYTRCGGYSPTTIKREYSRKKDVLTLTDTKMYSDESYNYVTEAPVAGEPTRISRWWYLNSNGCTIKCRFYDEENHSVFPPMVQGEFTLYSYNGSVVFKGEATATAEDFSNWVTPNGESYYRCISFNLPVEEIFCDIEDVVEMDCSFTVSDESLQIYNGKQIGPYAYCFESSGVSLSYDYWSEEGGTDSVLVRSSLPTPTPTPDVSTKVIETSCYSIEIPDYLLDNIYVEYDEDFETLYFKEIENTDSNGFGILMLLELTRSKDIYGPLTEYYDYYTLGTVNNEKGETYYLELEVPTELLRNSREDIDLQIAYDAGLDLLDSSLFLIINSIEGINGYTYIYEPEF